MTTAQPDTSGPAHRRRGAPGRSASDAGVERLLVSPEEAAAILGIGRDTVYDLMRTSALPSVKVGRCRRIPTTHLRDYVDRLPRTLPQDHP